MKYIITEEQNYKLIFLRRNSRKFLEPYLKKTFVYYDDDSYYNEGYNPSGYVEQIIDWCVDEIISDIDDDMDNNEHYGKIVELFKERLFELFKDDIISNYDKNYESYSSDPYPD